MQWCSLEDAPPQWVLNRFFLGILLFFFFLFVGVITFLKIEMDIAIKNEVAINSIIAYQDSIKIRKVDNDKKMKEWTKYWEEFKSRKAINNGIGRESSEMRQIHTNGDTTYANK